MSQYCQCLPTDRSGCNGNLILPYLHVLHRLTRLLSKIGGGEGGISLVFIHKTTNSLEWYQFMNGYWIWCIDYLCHLMKKETWHIDIVIQSVIFTRESNMFSYKKVIFAEKTKISSLNQMWLITREHISIKCQDVLKNSAVGKHVFVRKRYSWFRAGYSINHHKARLVMVSTVIAFYRIHQNFPHISFQWIAMCSPIFYFKTIGIHSCLFELRHSYLNSGKRYVIMSDFATTFHGVMQRYVFLCHSINLTKVDLSVT